MATIKADKAAEQEQRPAPDAKEVEQQRRKNRKELPPMASVYTKIAEVMDKVERIQKNGWNDFHKYKFATESDITDSVRPMLAQAGLAFFSNVLEQERTGDTTKVKMAFTLADIDTAEKLEFTFWGEGQDKGDKGLYKAYTGATKYFLKSIFLIATGDDPEYEKAPAPTPAGGKAPYKAPYKAPPIKAPQDPGPSPQGPKLISPGQQKRMFARAEGKADIVKKILQEYGLDKSEDVSQAIYDEVVEKIDILAAEQK